MLNVDLRLEELESVDAGEDVSVGVDLEEVAVVHVEPESPRGERRVVLELEQLLWVSERDEPLLKQPEAQNLNLVVC